MPVFFFLMSLTLFTKQKEINMKKTTLIFFIGAFILTGLLRLYHIQSPLADWHSWRQVDTSAVSRNLVQGEFDLLHPKFDDLSNVPAGLDNPEGNRFVEFPLFNLPHALAFIIFPFITLEMWGRLWAVGASLLTVTFLFLLVRKYTDDLTGLMVAGVYAVLPFAVYYGRVVLPDPHMIAAVIMAIYFFDGYLSASGKKKVLFFLCSLVFAIESLLFKPFALFFYLPIVYLSFSTYGVKVFKRWELYLYAVLAVLPLLLWRIWITQFPEGIPVSNWLFNGGNIRFTGAYFHWIFAERIGKLILGYYGVALLILGILYNSLVQFGEKKGPTHRGLFYSFLASTLIYLVVVARGNVQHDYYQIPIIPSLAIFTGLGARLLFMPVKGLFHPWVSRGVLGLIMLLMLAFTWYQVREFYKYDPTLVAVGKELDKTLPKDATVVTNRDGDTTFLYAMNRKGWASMSKSLPELALMGADYFVILYPKPEDKGISSEYPLISESPAYLLFSLKK